MRAAALLLVLLLLPGVPCAEARALEEGPGRPFCLRSAAAAAARPGNVNKFAPGTYEIAACGAPTGVSSRKKISSALVSATASAREGRFRHSWQRPHRPRRKPIGARSADSNGAGIGVTGVNLAVERVRYCAMRTASCMPACGRSRPGFFLVDTALNALSNVGVRIPGFWKSWRPLPAASGTRSPRSEISFARSVQPRSRATLVSLSRRRSFGAFNCWTGETPSKFRVRPRSSM